MTWAAIVVPEGTHPAEVDLAQIDGNAFNVMRHVVRGLREAGNPDNVVRSYQCQAMSGDYDHLLLVSIAFTDS